MNKQDIEVISTVLANPITARAMLDYLIARGVKLSVVPDKLTHQDIIEIVTGIQSELMRREK